MKIWLPLALAAAIAVACLFALPRTTHATAAAPLATARVEQGPLSDQVSQFGTLTYRARPDGSAYVAINRAAGIYTKLPQEGARVACGDVLYRVSDKPVLLLCGATPAYRSLFEGNRGPDVAELNAGLGVPPTNRFTSRTAAALRALQLKLGEPPTGSLRLGQAVFLPESIRIAAVDAELGATARPGAPLVSATSEVLEVHVALDPSQQDEVEVGDAAQITLPGNRAAAGTVARLGRVAQVGAGGATIPAVITLDHPSRARDLDQAPVRVSITTRGVENALSVPVTAIVGRSGGGYGVEVVRANGKRALVQVKPGLYDTAGGRVQIEGAVREGDRVVVPSP